MRIYVATSNAGKLREFQQAAAQLGFGEVDISSLPLPAGVAAPEETGDSFEANAALKACAYSRFTNDLVFADDSGLEVDALGGAPGIYSARYAGEGAGDAANNALLLERMHGVEARAARFICAIAVAQGGVTLAVFRGTIEGELLRAPRGEGGFGYDPLFFYPPLDKSTAELSADEKIQVSHRGAALRQLLQWLRTFAERTESD
ncbi:MAG: RdgB/HAM1 family non-canonical purine NTP pyrophosphatase [Bryobacterales bacterium]|jgi:XTP/dITP diphosphohydrolase|nr:RdgB/HAM1 family non-canonical purine NTP pyrophosphatase [Bryobacterales bacterium]